jgi:hypothetical protein
MLLLLILVVTIIEQNTPSAKALAIFFALSCAYLLMVMIMAGWQPCYATKLTSYNIFRRYYNLNSSISAYLLVLFNGYSDIKLRVVPFSRAETEKLTTSPSPSPPA